MKVAFDSLGCKVNQAETELLTRQFTEAGHRLVSSVDQADIYIVNTCTVTHVADAKSRHLLRLAHRRNPGAIVVVTGCYAQNSSQELAQLEGVSLVVGNDEKLKMLRLLERSGYLSSQTLVPEGSVDGKGGALRTRTLINIQDGCTSFCAYCVVPLVRGREKSLSADQVITEINHRAAGGFREVVLTGTKVGSYSDSDTDLKTLLELVLSRTDVPRLRLSSLQPQEITPELIALWHNQRLCPHFHLSLQSGSDSVLRRMKRCYITSDYQRAVALIRELVPDAAITTDVIVGFPGETEDEFEESYQFCWQTGFPRIHVFPYSLRAGTEASRLSPQIGDRVKKQRSQRMRALAGEGTENYNGQFLGRIMPVLWESRLADGLWSGLTGNYIRVYTRSNQDLTNELLPSRLVALRGDGVLGEVNPQHH